jgi:hypothetical protein
VQDIETFKEKLEFLITKFEKDKHHYLSKGYLEAQLRIDFLNPFFEALGWDIENKAFSLFSLKRALLRVESSIFSTAFLY